MYCLGKREIRSVYDQNRLMMKLWLNLSDDMKFFYVVYSHDVLGEK